MVSQHHQQSQKFKPWMAVDFRTPQGAPAYNVKGFDMILHGPPSEGVSDYTVDSAGDMSHVSHFLLTKGDALTETSPLIAPLQFVRWIEFDEIVFTNGKKWKTSEKSICEFLPEAPRDLVDLPKGNE